jgi:chromatin remodeling complex protein RSC6
MNNYTPVPISDELAVFIGRKKGSLVSKVEVGKIISEYIGKNCPSPPPLPSPPINRSIIYPDAALRNLLRIRQDNKLDFFNLMDHLRIHFNPDIQHPSDLKDKIIIVRMVLFCIVLILYILYLHISYMTKNDILL